MSEKLQPSFGDSVLFDRLGRRQQSAAENITDIIKSRCDDFWQDSQEFFPEYSDLIDNIKLVLEKRRLLALNGYEEVIGQIIKLTGFSVALSNAILINRLYPNDVPLVLDELQQQRVLDEASAMESEVGSNVLTQGKIDDALKEVFKGKLRLNPVNLRSPEQIELGL